MALRDSRAFFAALTLAALAAVGVGCELVASVDRDRILEPAAGAGGAPVTDSGKDGDTSVGGDAHAGADTGPGGAHEGGDTGPSCTNGAKDGTETDIDCGGSCSTKCAEGKGCNVAGDCVTQACTNNKCVSACNNGIKDGTESDKDCGGSCPTKCANQANCNTAADCVSNSCNLSVSPHVCVSSLCQNGAKDNGETDIDCGGPNCAKCDDAKSCLGDSDCLSDVCDPTSKACLTASCTDGHKNDGETDIDCGGTNACDRCDTNKDCAAAGDCKDGVCSGTPLKCVVSTCTDQVKNGTETDVDCGGSTCGACADGKVCGANGDCLSGVCDPALKTCSVATCSDQTQNGTETDVDCGGSCVTSASKKCANNQMCTAGTDCTSGVCNTAVTPHVCVAAGCTNLIKDGTETDVDCGGSDCPPCADGKVCVAGTDCVDKVCPPALLTCSAPTCGDNVQNGQESGKDCGGASSCPRCPDGEGCTVGTDCLSEVCGAQDKCAAPTCLDSHQNDGETDVDCGGTASGSGCPPCNNGQKCLVGTDCASKECDPALHTCNAPACDYGQQKGSESDTE